MKAFAQIGAFLSFFFCLLGGVWILSRGHIASKDNVLTTAIGFYFVGKAFFVGPSLLIDAYKRRLRKEWREEPPRDRPIRDVAGENDLY